MPRIILCLAMISCLNQLIIQFTVIWRTVYAIITLEIAIVVSLCIMRININYTLEFQQHARGYLG